MPNKKQRVIVLGATGNITFTVANVLTGIKKHSPNLNADIIIYHNGITEKDRNLMNSILPSVFTEYEFPVQTTQELENSSFGRYSKLAFSRYECFKLLDEYRQVLWIDTDILIQKDITGIFDYSGEIALYKESAPLQECFAIPLENFDMEGAHYNSGVLLLSDKLQNRHEIREWLYNKSIEYGKHLRYADQGIINLALQNFNLNITQLDEQYNCHPTKKSSKKACMVHSYSPEKFWCYFDTRYHFKEWDKNYQYWLKIGGSPYIGYEPKPTERFMRVHFPGVPNPVRQTSAFIKYLCNKISNKEIKNA